MAVINVRNWPAWAIAILYALFGMCLPLMAAILPEERVDALYHLYDGDNVKIDGPSILARKNFGKNTSTYANYYGDTVTSASIDVRTSGSPYVETRDEYSLGAEMLVDNSIVSVGYTNSEENDYTSNTYHFGLSHNMFSELTTVSLGFSYGDDEVRRNRRDINGDIIGNDLTFGVNGKEELKRRNYRLGLSQIFTKNLIVNFGFEAVADQGFTQNPYRLARRDNGSSIPDFIAERYPRTRTSNALAIRANYFLDYRAAIHAEYKHYTDTWGMKANMFKVEYVHPVGEQWTFDVRYRYYQQDQANFYKDVYAQSDTNLLYYGRDKELSTFSDQTYGFGVHYEFLHKGWWHFDKAKVSFSYDLITFEYDNFTNYDTESVNLGKLFTYSADVVTLYFSVWY